MAHSNRTCHDAFGAPAFPDGTSPRPRGTAADVLTRLLSLLPALLLFLLPDGGRLCAQTVEVAAESENFRMEAGGKKLATVHRGTRLSVVGSQGQWREVTLSGWIWTSSVSPTDRKGLDLAVSADGGENLRAEPDGGARILARVLEGFLLEKTGERGNWSRVRRTGWIWAPSLRVAGEEGRGTDPAAGEEGGAPSGEEEGVSLSDRLVVKGEPLTLHVSPGGDTLGRARPGTDLRVLERDGEWARVRTEAWVRTPEAIPPDSFPATGELTPADLKANPEQYVDRRVRWTLQFVSLEQAEAERTDFYEGEPYLLARTSGEGGGFVYVAVPEELLPEARKLQPLQEIQVVGRVRTGRSSLMGAPVLDLLRLRRSGTDAR